MGKYWMQLLVALLLVFSVAAGQEDESAEVQLRAALHKELVEGDLSGAIELYQKVVSNPNAGRATIARALLQIGLCYEKLGDAQARPVYRKLIDGYPEQLREVDVARRRLAEIAKMSAETSETPAFQHIQMTARLYMPASLSPQGNRMAFPHDLSLWIAPVHGKVSPEIAGVPEKLTGQIGVFGPLAWSGDGKWIAFNAFPEANFLNPDIYVISSGGGEPARVVADRFLGELRIGDDLLGISLSPDGRKLAYVSGLIGQEKVHVIPVTGGEAVPLSVDQSRQPAFSPDGKWIACVTKSAIQGIKDDEPNSDVHGALWIASSNGEYAVLVTEDPGRIRNPVWSPDGKMIAYLYDDGIAQSTRELQIIPIREDGRPAASPGKLKLPSAVSQLAGWTARNQIGIMKSVPETSGIYKVAVTGGRAALIRAGENEHPRWSPDGSRIYFGFQGGIKWIAAEGGESSDVPLRATEVVEDAYGGSNEPSPDGHSLVFAGYLKKSAERSINIWTVPSDGGVPRQISNFRSPAEARFPCWAPNGKVIAFIKADRGEAPGIYFAPAEGGDSRRIVGVGVARIAWSPNGTDIAYFSNVTLNLFNLQSGESRTVAVMRKNSSLKPPPSIEEEVAWSPDGKQLAYTYSGNIWLVSVDNPQPVSLNTGRAELRATHIDWSPDGKWLVFKGETGSDFELHLMTDFLPLVKR